MADRDSVEGLVYAYAYAYDDGDAEAIGAMYTEDGEFRWSITDGASGGPFVGPAEIAASSAASLASQSDQRRHVMSNVVVTADGPDRATARSYLVLGAVAQGALTVLATGTYRDECVRVDGTWRFRRRDLVMDLAF